MSTPYEFEGTVKEIMDLQTFPSGFCKREFVVTDKDDRYPQDIKFVAIKNNCALLDSVHRGDEVRVTFSLRGNCYNGRYYTDLQMFKLVKVEVDGSTAEPIPQPADEFPVDEISDEDMPF
ncbi:MAG: DUF3127 domain-containing protein [Kiritimatiellae bacterium]|nr:DUF3127 domain-containing protein [Kiritimatiellia bacterium]